MLRNGFLNLLNASIPLLKMDDSVISISDEEEVPEAEIDDILSSSFHISYYLLQ